MTEANPDSKASAKAAIRWALTVLCVAGLVVYVYENRSDFAVALKNLDVLTASLGILTVALQWAVRVYRDRLMYRSMGYETDPMDLAVVLGQQNLLNYLPLKAGTIYLAAHLRRKYSIGLSHFAAAFAAQNVLTISMTLLAAAPAIVRSGDAPSHSRWIAGAVVGTLAILSLVVLLVRLPLRAVPGKRLKTVIARIHEGMDYLSKDRRLWFVTLWTSLAGVLLTAWRTYLLLCLSLDAPTLSASLILTAGILISVLVSVTPAGIGIREAIVGVTSGTLALAPATGVLVSALDRVLTLSFIGILLLIAQFRTKTRTLQA